MKVITLSENNAGGMGLLSEWGLSILVEAGDVNILIDTGQSISLVNNMIAMDIDPSIIDKIVLSHGHIDHTGGLRQLLKVMKKQVEIIAHPDIWDSKYVKLSDGGGYHYIGMPFQQEELEELGAYFTVSTGPVWINSNIATTGEITMENDYEKVDSNLYIKQGAKFIADQVKDDLALIIKGEHGLTIVAGCAHRGIINTINHARKIMGIDIIDMVVGGTHLVGASDEQMEITISELKGFGMQRLGACHCTGFRALVRMAEEFGDIFVHNVAGTSLELI